MPQMQQDICLLGYKRSNSEYKSMSRGAKTHYAKVVFKIATLQRVKEYLWYMVQIVLLLKKWY